MGVPTSAWVGVDPVTAELLRELEGGPLANGEFQGKISNGSIIGTAPGDPDPNADGMDLINGGMQSRNFVAGTQGWRIDKDGDVEFSDGVFRGTVRQTAVAAKATRAGDVLNVAPGTYRLSGLSSTYNLGGEMTVGTDHIRIARPGVYLIIAYSATIPDASLAGAGLYLFGNSVLGAGTAALASIINNQPAGASMAFNLCAPFRLSVANMYVWAEVANTVQSDYQGGAFVAAQYLSEV